MSGLGTILTAIVTPFDEEGSVNEESFVALMRHLAENGSDGFVVAGTTGEASTLTDEEQLGLIELAVAERPPGKTIVAGTGTNDTRQAVFLTERATELGRRRDAVGDALLQQAQPPRPQAPLRSDREGHRQTDPALQHPRRAPARTWGPTCSPSSRRSTGSRASSRPTPRSCSRSTASTLYAGDDATFARTLDMGGAGGILVASHIVGNEMRRMVDEPEHRAEIDASLRDVYETLFLTSNPTCTKAALNLLGHDVGGLRLPLVEATAEETAAVRAMLERHGLVPIPPARTPA